MEPRRRCSHCQECQARHREREEYTPLLPLCHWPNLAGGQVTPELEKQSWLRSAFVIQSRGTCLNLRQFLCLPYKKIKENLSSVLVKSRSKILTLFDISQQTNSQSLYEEIRLVCHNLFLVLSHLSPHKSSFYMHG